MQKFDSNTMFERKGVKYAFSCLFPLLKQIGILIPSHKHQMSFPNRISTILRFHSILFAPYFGE